MRESVSWSSGCNPDRVRRDSKKVESVGEAGTKDRRRRGVGDSKKLSKRSSCASQRYTPEAEVFFKASAFAPADH